MTDSSTTWLVSALSPDGMTGELDVPIHATSEAEALAAARTYPEGWTVTARLA